MDKACQLELPHLDALRRHLVDLRDGTHGDVITRRDKEELFVRTTALLDPFARQVLEEMNTLLMLGTGTVDASGVTDAPNGGTMSTWELSWPEQRARHVYPVMLIAYYGREFHHPHLFGGTVREWPLNVFDEEQAAAAVPTLHAIATAELHNLVLAADYRLVPAITSEPGRR